MLRLILLIFDSTTSQNSKGKVMENNNEYQNWQKYEQAMSGHAPRSEILEFVEFIKRKEGLNATKLKEMIKKAHNDN